MKDMLWATNRLTPACRAAATRLRVPTSRRRALRAISRHFARFERIRQVGELVDHDLRPDLVQMVAQSIRVEHVDHDRFYSSFFQFRGLFPRSRGTEHTPSVLQKEGGKAPADGA